MWALSDLLYGTVLGVVGLIFAGIFVLPLLIEIWTDAAKRNHKQEPESLLLKGIVPKDSENRAA